MQEPPEILLSRPPPALGMQAASQPTSVGHAPRGLAPTPPHCMRDSLAMAPETLPGTHPEQPGCSHQHSRRGANTQEGSTRAERARDAAQHLPREKGRPASPALLFLLCGARAICAGSSSPAGNRGLQMKFKRGAAWQAAGLRLLRGAGAALVCAGSERARVQQLFGQVSPGASHGPGSLPSLLGWLTRAASGGPAHPLRHSRRSVLRMCPGPPLPAAGNSRAAL